MKKIVTIILLSALSTGIGCKLTLGQKKTNFEMGKGKLIDENKPLEAIPYLEEALKKERQKVRTRSYLVIACKRAEDAPPTKVKGDKERYIEKGRQHLEKLGQVAGQAVEELLDIMRDPQAGRILKDAMQVIVDLDAPAATPLVDAYIEYAETEYIREGYAGLHNDIITMLTQMGSAAIPSLTKALENATTPILVRREIARILGDIGNAKAQKELEKQLNVTDSGLKMEAVIALYKLNNKKQYADIIITGLDNPNVSARRAAARALINMNEFPTKKLIEALNDRDRQVRINATKAIGKHPKKEAIDPLIKVLKSDEDDAVKNAIAEALTELGAKYGKYIVEVLVKELGVMTDWKVRSRVVSILSNPSVVKYFNKDSAYLLDKHYLNKEDNPTVKDDIGKLLIILQEKGI